jgi:hypothetical protein
VSEKPPVAPRCKYGLHDFCHFWFATGEYPDQKDCILCLKAYRLRHGLKTIVEGKGLRTGVTL